MIDPKVEGDAYCPALDWYAANAGYNLAMGFKELSKGMDADARYRFCLSAQYLEDIPVVLKGENNATD
jgi:hypothetical protein